MKIAYKEEEGIGLSTVILVVFIILKLTGNIDWSWWWVLSPLWIPIAIILIIAVLTAIFVGDK